MVQHRRPPGGGARHLLVGGALAALMGCELRDIERVPAPPRQPSIASVASMRLDEASELGASCPSPLDACGSGLPPSCRVSCQPTVDGCAAVWELYRLNVVPRSFTGQWLGLAADGSFGIFVRFPTPEPCRYPSPCWLSQDEESPQFIEYLTWSAADGVLPLSSAADVASGLIIDRVSDDASVALGRMGTGDSFLWTRAAGLQPIPLRSAAMARHGRLFAGLRGEGAARWAPDSGLTDAVELALPRAAHAEGDAALYVAVRSLVYNPAPGELTTIALPPDVSPEARFDRAVLSASGTSFAVSLWDADGVHLYRWSDGALDRVELPARVQDHSSIDARISDDGRVIVAVVSSDDDEQPEQRSIVRWSAETGTQLLTEDPTFSLGYVSSAGDVILGRIAEASGRRRVLRWTLDAGMQETVASHVDERVAFNGDVVVDVDSSGILVHKYDDAMSVPLPIDHLRGRLVPQRWFELALQRASPDARVLAGTATDDPGNGWLWLARLQSLAPSGAPCPDPRR